MSTIPASAVSAILSGDLTYLKRSLQAGASQGVNIDLLRWPDWGMPLLGALCLFHPDNATEMVRETIEAGANRRAEWRHLTPVTLLVSGVPSTGDEKQAEQERRLPTLALLLDGAPVADAIDATLSAARGGCALLMDSALDALQDIAPGDGLGTEAADTALRLCAQRDDVDGAVTVLRKYPDLPRWSAMLSMGGPLASRIQDALKTVA